MKLAEQLGRDTSALSEILDRDAGEGKAESIHPLHESPTPRQFLLVVDQFEELFTLCRDENERAAFVDNLMTAVEANGPTLVVITLRADFYAHCAGYPRLREFLKQVQAYIGPMSAAELRRAIEAPAL